MKRNHKATLTGVDDLKKRIGNRMDQDIKSAIWAVLEDIPPALPHADYISQQIPNTHRSLFTKSGFERIDSRVTKIKKNIEDVRSITGAPHEEAEVGVESLRGVASFYRDALETITDFEDELRQSSKPMHEHQAYMTEVIYQAVRPSLKGREASLLSSMHEDAERMRESLKERVSDDYRNLSKSQLLRLKTMRHSFLMSEVDQLFIQGKEYDHPLEAMPDNREELYEKFASDRMDSIARACAGKIGKMIFDSTRKVPSTLFLKATADDNMNIEWALEAGKDVRIKGRAYVESEARSGWDGTPHSNGFISHRNYGIDLRSVEYRKGKEWITDDQPLLSSLKTLPERMQEKPKRSLSGSMAGISLKA